MKTKIFVVAYILSTFFVNLAYGRWPVKDPKAEKYYATSPYVYCNNNPVLYVDPNGEDYYLNLLSGQVQYVDGSKNLYDKGLINIAADDAKFGDIENALSDLGFEFSIDNNVAGGFAVDTRSAAKGWLIQQIFSPDHVGTILALGVGSGETGGTVRSMAGRMTGQIPTLQVAGVTQTGGNYVYHSVQNGVTEYVGITNNLARRSAEHLARNGRNIEKIISGLSRSDAKAVEQALIELHGLAKNGGSLSNKINSIAQTDPTYAMQVKRGLEILKTIK